MEKFEKLIEMKKNLMGKIRPTKTALLVIDMQKYQVQKEWIAYKSMDSFIPGSWDYFVEEVEKKVVPNLQKLIDFCHEIEIPVIYTKFSGYMRDGSDFPELFKLMNKFAKETYGEFSIPHISHPSSEIIDELKPREQDVILQKNTSGAFISTRLDSFLKNMRINTVLISGVVTNFCVECTGREAADYGFRVIIIDDCCAAWSPELYEMGLQIFQLSYGFVLTCEKVIKKIKREMKKEKKVSTTH